ncbi:MAG: hypothetical protein OHK93_004310 [Ramalina farinacea]|uniref:Uncharacterized protein n=1 Tax=Ramalina farinacea TaxID=258253 RepID=A0AA43TTE2_9LECA|nr:hypothetical protein [Ramalina farinacea]
MSEADKSSSDASMVHGHAAYVAAAAKETLGSYTSTPMQEAGASDKQAALTEMREAKKAGEEQAGGGGVQKSETLGKVEQFAGKATGCEGMEEEGGKRMQ